MPRHQILLIPGFFAFAGLGDLRYWSGVDTELARAFEELGLEVDITEIQSLPTASIRWRAARVVEAIANRPERPRWNSSSFFKRFARVE